MRFSRCSGLLLLGLAAACDSTEPGRPAEIQVLAGELSGPAGVALADAPSFLVKDQRGEALAGVPVSVAVVTGGGTLSAAPAASGAAALPVGQWTLGPRAGLNEITITVEGLASVRISAVGVPGAPARFTGAPAERIVGRVATAVDPAIRATLIDAFENPLPGVPVTIAASGGRAAATLTSAADGAVTVPEWVLGTVRGEYTLTMVAGAASATFTAWARSGPPASLGLVSGGSQAALAGTEVSQAIRASVQDEFGNPADSVSVSFVVVEGEGSLSSASGTTSLDGVVELPTWTLGRAAGPQRVRVMVGAFSLDVAAEVQTEFNVDVRFFGGPVSDAIRAHFERAARRLSGAVIGDLPAVSASNLDVSVCGVSGAPALNETIDDLIIFARVAPIDGPGKVLGSAGPCYIRSGGGLPVIGVMDFDEADIQNMDRQGYLEGVVLHEMVHVLGIGIGRYWNPMLTGRGTQSVAYLGARALQGCLDSSGFAACDGSVPVENSGGPGTVDSHWRETVFQTELMTGYISRTGMPMSRVTLGGLADIGYRVNLFARDAYTVRAPGPLTSRSPAAGAAMDRVIQPSFEIGSDGETRPVDGDTRRPGRPIR